MPHVQSMRNLVLQILGEIDKESSERKLGAWHWPCLCSSLSVARNPLGLEFMNAEKSCENKVP